MHSYDVHLRNLLLVLTFKLFLVDGGGNKVKLDSCERYVGYPDLKGGGERSQKNPNLFTKQKRISIISDKYVNNINDLMSQTGKSWIS